MKKNITLALETGIYGGSICLLKNRREIAGWIGESVQTKSNEYLESIKTILYTSHVKIGEINKIVISEGPGSYTGLRIGFSIAKGLKTALGIEIEGISVLEAIAQQSRPITTIALPFGKNEVCWKKTGKSEENAENAESVENNPVLQISQNPATFSRTTDFIDILKHQKPANLILPEKLYSELTNYADFPNKDLNIIYTDTNLAHTLGMSMPDLISDREVEIIYPKTLKAK